MPGLEFVVSLADRMSGPAHNAGSSVRQLTSDLRQLQGQLSHAKALGDIEGFRRYSDAVRDVRRQVFEAGKGGGPSSDGALHMSLLDMYTLSAVVTTVASAYGVLAEKILSAANAEQSFNRLSLAAYSSLGGGASAGQAVYDVVEGLTKRLPIAKEQLSEWTKALMASGITDSGVIRRIDTALSGSFATMGAEGAQNLLTTMRKVQEAIDTNHGLKLADKQLVQLAKTGVNVNDVAKEMGVSAESLQKQLKAGTVDAGKFGDALLTAVEKKGRGPLHAMWLDLDVLKKKGLEFGQNLFQNVDLGPAGDAVQRFLSLLDQSTAAGSDLEKGVRKGTNGIVQGFADMTDAVTIAYLKIAAFALDADTALMPLEKRVNRIIHSFTGTSLGKLILGAASLGTYDPNAPAAKVAPTPAVTSAADRLRQAAGAVARARVVGGVKGAELQAMGDQLSDSLAAGIKQGLISREEGIKLQGIALGKAAVEGVKKGSDSHSPSRATFRIGGFIGDGLAGGIMGSRTVVDRAVMHLGERATRASLFMRAAHGGGAQEIRAAHGGGGVSIAQVNVNLTAPNGVTDATELTAFGVAIALERQQLMGAG